MQASNLSVKNLRTVNSYESDVQALNQNLNSKGVKHFSCLNQLQYFNVCNPGLPPCIAHDVYEGIVPFDLSYIIQNLIEKGYFSYNYLNAKLQNMRFENELYFNKLPVIKKGKKLAGSASENVRLVQIILFAIYNKISDYTDCVWQMQMLITLREMCSLLLAVF